VPPRRAAREYRPGDEVPSEHELAVAWKVARPTAARALESLRRQGFVSSVQGSSTYVRDPSAAPPRLEDYRNSGGSRNFHRAFVGRCEKAGVPVTTVHATRKACASLLVALDVHPRVAMQILRHSQIAVTMDVYSQVTSDSTLNALKRLGEQLEGGNAA
jgi:DNA-binding transcriptional regulator YhcF (GntR family)